MRVSLPNDEAARKKSPICQGATPGECSSIQRETRV